MKFPGTYAAYAVIEAVFGQTAQGIHYGLLAVNLATILLVYHLGNRFFGSRHTAVMAAAIYAISSLSFSFMGPMAHATHFVVFFGLAGIALLFGALRWNSTLGFALAGAVTGLAYMAKQSGFYFVPFGCLIVLSRYDWHPFCPPVLRALSYFLAGAFAPFAFTVFLFQQLGCLDEFVFWTFRYASTYGSSLSDALELIPLQVHFITHWGLGWIFFAPCILIFLPPIWRRASLPRANLLLLALFLALSFAGVALGLLFRQHYFIQALPAVALLSALSLATISAGIFRRNSSKYAIPIALLICLTLCGTVVAGEASSFFFAPPARIIWELYRGRPFVEAITVSDYIRQHSDPQDRIFVFGSEPEIYFYSKRRAATSNIYLYNLLENQPYASQMQRRMIADVENCRPRYFISAHEPILTPPDIERRIALFQWEKRYLTDYYRPVLMLDRDFSKNRLILRKSFEAPRFSYNGCYIIIWERK